MTCQYVDMETGDGKYCKKCGARLIIEDSPVFAAMKEQRDNVGGVQCH